MYRDNIDQESNSVVYHVAECFNVLLKHSHSFNKNIRSFKNSLKMFF